MENDRRWAPSTCRRCGTRGRGRGCGCTGTATTTRRGAQQERGDRRRRHARFARPAVDDAHRGLDLDLQPPPIRRRGSTPKARGRASASGTPTARAATRSGSRNIGQVTALADVGTDPERLNSFTAELAVRDEHDRRRPPWRFNHFRKTNGYANMPLDGLWLRAPYLHNGSVPTCARCSSPRSGRRRSIAPTTSTTGTSVGFVSSGVGGRAQRRPLRHEGARQRQRRTPLRHDAVARGEGSAARIPEDAMTASREPRSARQPLRQAARRALSDCRYAPSGCLRPGADGRARSLPPRARCARTLLRSPCSTAWP